MKIALAHQSPAEKSSEFEQRLNASSDKVNKKLFELRINNSDTFHNPERFLREIIKISPVK